MAEISRLENLYKTTQSQKVKQELEVSICKLKELDATSATKKLLYAKQHCFDHRDKPNEVLPRVLAQSVNKAELADVMISRDGSPVSSLEDKLALFSHHYTNLYNS